MIYIYKITHIDSQRVYIGQAKNVEKRWREHCKLNSNCTKLRNAIQKYGRNAFKFEVLLTCPPELANEIETGYIQWFDSVNSGFNICPIGGSSRGIIRSEEHRRKLSVANKGKRLSKETRQKMSKTKKGKSKSNEHRAKLAAINKTRGGEKHRWSKLTDIQRKEIKELYATGTNKAQIAAKYGVSYTCIHRITKGTK